MSLAEDSIAPFPCHDHGSQEDSYDNLKKCTLARFIAIEIDSYQWLGPAWQLPCWLAIPLGRIVDWQILKYRFHGCIRSSQVSGDQAKVMAVVGCVTEIYVIKAERVLRRPIRKGLI